MKSLFLICLSIFLLIPIVQLTAQSTESEWDIQLGKRKNQIFARQINEINLGNSITSYNPVYFKVGKKGTWQKVGLTGGNILPYLPSNDFAEEQFRQYKSKKIRSYWCLGGAIAGIVGWTISSADFAKQRRSLSVGTFLNKRSFAFLAGAIGVYSLGIHWNSKADIHLFMAISGERIKPEDRAFSLELGPGADGGIGLLFTF